MNMAASRPAASCLSMRLWTCGGRLVCSRRECVSWEWPWFSYRSAEDGWTDKTRRAGPDRTRASSWMIERLSEATSGRSYSSVNWLLCKDLSFKFSCPPTPSHTLTHIHRSHLTELLGFLKTLFAEKFNHQNTRKLILWTGSSTQFHKLWKLF